MFLGDIKHKNPEKKLSTENEASFPKNSPVIDLVDEGIDFIKTIHQEDVYITSVDGLKLHAIFLPADGVPGKFVIGIHGFQSNALNEFAPHVSYYHSRGFSMLLPDNRGHGYSEGEYITMGIKERLDCISWANYLVSRFGPDIKILLHGVSMGASAVLSASGEKKIPQQVFGVVSDCGYTCIKDILRIQLRNFMYVPTALPVAVCQWYAKHRAGFDFNEARPIDQVKKAKVPILFIQGDMDVLIPCYMARDLYNACSSNKELLIVDYANHAESIAMDSYGYHKAMKELFGI